MIWPMGADTSHHYSHDDAQVHHLAETRTGRVYQHNYDRLVAMDDVPLFAVIDSECDDGTAGDIVRQAFLDAAPSLRVSSSADAAQQLLVQTVQTANQAIMAARPSSTRPIGGCSVVGCTYRQGFVCGVHVGECRVFQLQAAQWRPITSEHTLLGMLRAQPQIEMPDIDPEQSKRIVTRVVGLTETVEVDTFRFPVVSRASVILCSPGAWAPLDPDASGGAIPDCPSESAMVAFALDAYVRAGELDNFTTIYASFRRRG